MNSKKNTPLLFPCTEDFIRCIADYILQQYPHGHTDFSRIAVIFGGRRPGLFLRRHIAARLKQPFMPPRLFSMDEFITHLSANQLPQPHQLDACWHIYHTCREHAPDMVTAKSFIDFLPWAQEIISFIEQLDLENIPDSALYAVEKSAAIGYDIPESINRILQHIAAIRTRYHQRLKEYGYSTRGARYLAAAHNAPAFDTSAFELILFCGFFYMHTTEARLIGALCEKNALCIFQGNPAQWPVLTRTAAMLNMPLPEQPLPAAQPAIQFYRGFDIHSQACLVADIVKNIPRTEDIVIVVPRPESLLPLLSQVTPILKECNVSMGYPLRRSSVFSLCEALSLVHTDKNNQTYYARDYLNAIRHPLIKNLPLSGDAAITRVLVHKIEEALQGCWPSEIAGKLFITLDELERDAEIPRRTYETLGHISVPCALETIGACLKQFHDLLFRNFESLETLEQFSLALETLLNALSAQSPALEYPFTVKAIAKLYELVESFSAVSLRAEPCGSREMWKLFLRQAQGEVVSFLGSPLRGAQILGLFETRSLNFKHVIIIDMNEGVLPQLTVHEPLIPRDIMISLGINRLEHEEEIQRYQCVRLLAGAAQAHLIYEDSPEKEKSRFIEELIWDIQKKKNTISAIDIPQALLRVHPVLHTAQEDKTPEILAALKKDTYSASRINTYLECPLRFYYRYVAGLRPQKNMLESPEADAIGTFLHETLAEMFARFIGRAPQITPEFRAEFFKYMEKKFSSDIERRMKSDSFLVWGVLRRRMEQFLDAQTEHPPQAILSLETAATETLPVAGSLIPWTYSADRVDRIGPQSALVIDYKSGSTDIRPGNYASLSKMGMARVEIRSTLKSFQLPLYYVFVSRAYPGYDINAELYNLRTLKRQPFFRPGEEDKKNDIMRIALRALEMLMLELWDPSVPFTADPDEHRCGYCAYQRTCKASV